MIFLPLRSVNHDMAWSVATLKAPISAYIFYVSIHSNLDKNCIVTVMISSWAELKLMLINYHIDLEVRVIFDAMGNVGLP